MFEKETDERTKQYMDEYMGKYNCENTKLETDNYNAGLEQGYEDGFQDGVNIDKHLMYKIINTMKRYLPYLENGWNLYKYDSVNACSDRTECLWYNYDIEEGDLFDEI